MNVRDRRRRDVQDAILAQRAAYTQYQAAQRSVEAAEENLRFAEARYEQGATNALELNTARNDLQRATADRITAKYSYVLAVKLLDILQGLPLTL
ncbi:MAG: TolC family protein [Flavobacteriales bacterium]|nr:TolC family protein [Flavobacteriales bacterium]